MSDYDPNAVLDDIAGLGPREAPAPIPYGFQLPPGVLPETPRPGLGGYGQLPPGGGLSDIFGPAPTPAEQQARAIQQASTQTAQAAQQSDFPIDKQAEERRRLAVLSPPPPPQSKLPGKSKGTSLSEHSDKLTAAGRPDSIDPEAVPFAGESMQGLNDLVGATPTAGVGEHHIRYQLPGGEWKEYGGGGSGAGATSMPNIAPFRDDAVFGHARSAPTVGPPLPNDMAAARFRPQDTALPSNYDPGRALSSPGGNTEADYLRYRAHDPLDLLSLQKQVQDEHTALERGKVGGPPAEMTAGEKLAAAQEYKKRTEGMVEARQAMDQRMSKNHAAMLQLQAWKAGLADSPDGMMKKPYSDAEYKQRDAELADDRQAAQKALDETLAYMHQGSGGAAGFSNFAR